jgi:hypothetical protein
MTTVDSVTGPRTAVARRLASLVGQEVRHFARHPVLWLVPPVVVVTSSLDGASAGRNAAYWYGTIFVAVAFFAPLIVVFAANLVASSARRSRAEQMLEVTPTSDPRRTLAMCLGIALPLAATGTVAAAAMALIDAVYHLPPEGLLKAGELAQLPFILAGAGLLGALGARWLPFTGGALITFVASTLGASIVFRRIYAGNWWMWWSTSTSFEETPAPAVPGNTWLHAAYLLGLCACAVIAAVFRDRTQWSRLALVGGPVLAATLVVGWLQLP